MSNEKKNLQQNPSRYFRVLTAVLFLADVVLAPWLREGNRSFSVRVFIQSVKAVGGIEKFALTEAGKGNIEGIANLTMSYWCIYLIIVLGAVLLLRAAWLLAGRKERFLSGAAYALGFLYLCAFMVFNYYGYSGGMIVGMLLVFLDAMLGKYLDERQALREAEAALRAKEQAEKEEKKRREAFPGRYGSEFYRVIFKNFRANIRDFLLFLAGAVLTMTVLLVIWGMEQGCGGIRLLGASALQQQIASSLKQLLPVFMLLAVLMLSLIISGYLRTRMKNYSMYIALGIRNKTLIRIIGLEYGTCILAALAGGILLGLASLKIIGVPIAGNLLRMLPPAVLCYLLVVLISTLVNYHIFEFKNVLRYNRSSANEPVPRYGAGVMMGIGLFVMLGSLGLFARRGSGEDLYILGGLIAGFGLFLYGAAIRILKKRVARLQVTETGLLTILPWRNRFRTNVRFLFLLTALQIMLFGIFLPRLAAQGIPPEKTAPYDYVAMVYDSDLSDLQGLKKEGTLQELPMLRATTPLGADISRLKKDYRTVLWPQGQHIAVSESSYRKLCRQAGKTPQKLNLSADGHRVHIVMQQNAASEAHNLEWYSGGGGNLFRLGQPLVAYDRNQVTRTYIPHDATYERTNLVGALHAGNQENILVLSDSYFRSVYSKERTPRNPSVSIPPSAVKEGPDRLVLIQVKKAGTESREDIEGVLEKIQKRHSSDRQYDESIRTWYSVAKAEKNNGAAVGFTRRMEEMTAVGLVLMVLFTFCIRYSLAGAEQRKEYRLLGTLGMNDREQEKLFSREARTYVVCSMGSALALAAPFAALLPVLRMFRRSQSLLYLRNLMGLGGGTIAVLLLALTMLTRYYRRVNR